MAKRNKIIYWIATLWLALGMTSMGIVQLMKVKSETDLMDGLGYPAYLLALLGTTKLLGVVVVLIPKFPLLKEWAYAGFFFTTAGAIYSHMAAGNNMDEIFPPLLLLVLTVVSWYMRPAGRKPVVAIP